jgi:uncharacterized glyoxalase superfamily protein PhnB
MSDPTMFPSMSYDDAQAAVDFLCEAFGFERHAVYTNDNGTVGHAELRYGNGAVMFGSATGEMAATRGRGGGVYVVVDDPDAHCAQARAAGAEITRDLHDTEYGSREYAAKDPEGNTWYFGTYQPFAFDHEAEQAKASA